MSTKSLFVSGLLVTMLGGVAAAKPAKATPPAQDDVLTGRTGEVRDLLGEVRAARGAIARGEVRAARELVGDAIALEASLGAHHRYALIAADSGTLEQASGPLDAPVVTEVGRFSDREVLDLQKTRDDLASARNALTSGMLREAEQSLAMIGDAITVKEHIVPDEGEMAAENLRLALRELRMGDWHGSKVALDAALKDVSKLAATQAPAKTTAKK